MLFGLAIACPFAAAAIFTSDLPDHWRNAAGFLIFPVPEILDIAAISVLGKPGFEYLKKRIALLFKQYGPPRSVSPMRYHIGLALFLLPLLFGWVQPYVATVAPDLGIEHLTLSIGVDIVFLSSFFVLGGDFWDKIRALFVRAATVNTGAVGKSRATEHVDDQPIRVRWRLYLGAALMLLSLFMPVFIPFVTLSTLPTELKATLSGLMLFGFPQIITLTAIVVLGKSGFLYIKTKSFQLLKRFLPTDEVSVGRHRFGLVVLAIPFLFAVVAPYVKHSIPGYDELRVIYAGVGDVLLIVAVFVLGGNFWGKLRALFSHSAKACF